MEQVPEIPEFLPRLFPQLGKDGLRLFAAAAEQTNLLQADFLIIRDLLELSGLEHSETLHVLLLCLTLALEEGSLCLEMSPAGLERRLVRPQALILGSQSVHFAAFPRNSTKPTPVFSVEDALAGLAGESEAKSWAARVLADHSEADSDLFGSETAPDQPIVVVASEKGKFLYFHKYFLHESTFRDAVRNRLASFRAQSVQGAIEPVMNEVLEDHPLRAGDRPLLLDARQRQAIRTALSRDFAVISGGPGTGKTSIVVSLLRCLVRLGCHADRIALAAPTGRAAQRLTDAIREGLGTLPPTDVISPDDQLLGLTAQTLHRLLEYSPGRGIFRRHAENPVPADVIIVDEVSMVGVELMSRLFQAAAPEAKLVLLGDKDQLPSVDAGAVIANLVAAAAQADFVVMLAENYRSQPEIRAAARAINVQEASIVERLPMLQQKSTSLAQAVEAAGCWFWPLTGQKPSELRPVVEAWAHQQYLTPAEGPESYAGLVKHCGELTFDSMPARNESLDRLFQALNRGRLLTIVREGPWGSVDINSFLAQMLRPGWDRAGRSQIFAGAPVLITCNDYSRQLFNGDVGVTLRSRSAGSRVFFQRQEGYTWFPVESLPAHELGFALTVHKSQGSEYGRVLLVLPPHAGRRLLTKEIVYTAVTRAKDLAIICSTEEALKHAIGRRIERDSGPGLLQSIR